MLMKLLRKMHHVPLTKLLVQLLAIICMNQGSTPICASNQITKTQGELYKYLSAMYCSYYSITQINTVQAFMRILTNF